MLNLGMGLIHQCTLRNNYLGYTTPYLLFRAKSVIDQHDFPVLFPSDQDNKYHVHNNEIIHNMILFLRVR